MAHLESLKAHEAAIVKIEKYFEFGFDSEKDKQKVMEIINNLHETLEHH